MQSNYWYSEPDKTHSRTEQITEGEYNGIQQKMNKLKHEWIDKK